MPEMHRLMKLKDKGVAEVKRRRDVGLEKLMPKGMLPYGQVPLTESEQWEQTGQAWLAETPEEKALIANDLLTQFPDQPDMFTKREAHFGRLAQKYREGRTTGEL